MARLCIRIAPNDHPTDASLTPLRTRVGDVVVIMPDGHQFSQAELNCGQYKFVDVPGVAPSTLQNLLDPVFDANGIMTKRRAFALDPTQINSDVWKSRTTATAIQISSLIVTRP